MSETPGMRLLREHVERFNHGVERGDFGRMLDAFSDDAVMAFEGIPVGPFHGRAAIAAAYREQPPDGRIRVLHAAEPEPGSVVAAYAWVDGPPSPAGELRLRHRDGRISSLVVTYDASATGAG